MLQILMTGFEPFGGSPMNPSALLTEALVQEGLPGAVLHAAILPVIGGLGTTGARSNLAGHIQRIRPEVVICLGESNRSTHIAFERVAINLRDDRIADNAGVQCRDLPVVEGGPDAYFSCLPVREMRDACEGEGVPALLSTSAGSFLCNEVMYGLLHGMARGEFPTVVRGGFIHVPQLPEQAAQRGGPSMRLAHMLLGLRPSLLALVAPLG